MKSTILKAGISTLLLAPTAAFAATDGSTSSGFNPMLWGLLSIIIVLAIVIIMLASVYLQLAFAYREKWRKERSSGTIVKTVLLLLLAGIETIQARAQEVVADTAAVATPQASPFINGIARTDFYALVGMIAFELLIVGVLVGIIYRMVRILRNIPDTAGTPAAILFRRIIHKLTNTVAVKDEERIVLQHEYDGIRELDNSLPPWWKYGFILTIFFAVGYMWYYHVHNGPNQIDEYNAAVAKAEKEKAALMAKAGPSVDESNVTLIVDKAQLADAAVLFKNTCAACHRADGGGMVGPNLTDKFWLHGGSLQDIFKSIKYGWQDKGMPAWKTNLSANQIAQLASYIKHLSGTNVPGGKEPQGEPYDEKAASAGSGTKPAETSGTPDAKG